MIRRGLAAAVPIVASLVVASPAQAAASTVATLDYYGVCDARDKGTVTTTVKLRKGNKVHHLTQDFYRGKGGSAEWLGNREKDVRVRAGQTTVKFVTCVPYSIVDERLHVQVGALTPTDYVPFVMVKVRTISSPC